MQSMHILFIYNYFFNRDKKKVTNFERKKFILFQINFLELSYNLNGFCTFIFRSTTPAYIYVNGNTKNENSVAVV